MAYLRLVEPSVALEKEYRDMLHDWQMTGEPLIPFVLKMDAADFGEMVRQLHGYRQGIGVPATFVPHATYWLIDGENKILGVVNIRPYLNQALRKRGGHIGYGVRPSERRKGYATRMLQLALAEAKGMGIKKALITCDKANTGSARVIMGNSGILEAEETIAGVLVQRYWIEIN